MNRREEQTMRDRIRAHEQRVDINVDTDALWGRLAAESLQPKIGLKRGYRVAVAAALLAAGATWMVSHMSNVERSKVLVGKEALKQSPANTDEARRKTDEGKPRVEEVRFQKEKPAAQKHRGSATTEYVDNVTEYLKGMDIPVMMGMYAGREDIRSADAEHADTKWICY